MFFIKTYQLSDQSYQRPNPPSSDPLVSQFRDVLNGQSLAHHSTQTLQHFLEMLDPMMAKDIDETMKAYEMKKKPILEVSKKKKILMRK